MSELRRGYLFGIAAYGLWGLFPLYWRLVEESSALEVLAHRIVWSAVFVGIILGAAHQLGAVRGLLREPRQLVGIGLAAVIISVNWGTYIYGVNTERVVETSLGYFINPLISVLFGVLVFAERLRGWQWVAVGVGGAAVLVLTVDYGRPPWIALTLAISFATYGLVKKSLGLPAARGLFAESAVIALPAAVFLLWLGADGSGTFTSEGVGYAMLLVGAGIATAVPLLFFAGAANRIPLTAIGMLQYLAPAMHFAIGVALFGESMTAASWFGFALIWTALVIFTTDAVRHTRRAVGPSAAVPVTAE